jgi:GGDEF domain-containing protein
MATQVGLDNKIDKVLKVPEIIVTSSTNTLALKGLEVSSSAQNQVVTIDPLTGVLNRSSFLSTVEENVDYRATEGQLCLQRPVPLPHLTKLMYTVMASASMLVL